jgi:pyruvate dehydrogenase E2 component (dihydrolipoamide acetyltransferase)
MRAGGEGGGRRVVRDLVMPRLGLTMKKGRITRWYVTPGQAFRRGDRLLQVTTEKVAVDVEAAYDGVLVEILRPEGATVPVAAPIARVETAAERVLGAADPARAAPGAGEEPSRVRATPAARRAAREFGVDLAAVAGSGPEGRITEDDVRRQAAASAAPPTCPAPPGPGAPEPAQPPGPGAPVPHSEWRRAVAEKMTLAARTTAPVTLHRTVDFGPARDLIEREEARRAGIGPVDLVVKAAAEALAEHPDLNSTFTEEALIRHAEVNIGVALALPEGLIVPVLRGAERLGLAELAARRRELFEKARQGRLSPDDVSGGTFTVSNLGPQGVDGFTPIINPPEVAVLGVGRLEDRPAALGGRVAVRPGLTLSLTFDHRAVDGAPAALFLASVAERLAHPPASWSAGLPRRPRLSGEGAFDLVVVGGGPAGFAAAVLGAELGGRVALVEAGEVGGVCLNRGCVPTKAALEYLVGLSRRATPGGGPGHSSRGASRAAGPGTSRAAGPGTSRAAGVQAAVAEAVLPLRAGAESRLADLGVRVLRGTARLGPEPLTVMIEGERAIRGSAIILAVGCEPARLDLPPGVKAGRALPVEDLLGGAVFGAGQEPGTALVVGGGPGGVEAARTLALAGVETTLVERLDSLLPGEEPDIGALVRAGLEALGVEVRTGTEAAGLSGSYDVVIAAVGRQPRTADLGLEGLDPPGSGPLLDAAGFVVVDDHLATAVPGLYAAGDVTGPPLWAHRATGQGRAAALNALAGLEGLPGSFRPRPGPPPEEVPRVVFSDPEFGAVGLGPSAAGAGRRVVSGTALMMASSRARAAGLEQGFVRVTVDRETGRVLGLEAVCPAATEVVTAGLMALRGRLTVDDLAASCAAHPTYGEALVEAARDAWRALLLGPAGEGP